MEEVALWDTGGSGIWDTGGSGVVVHWGQWCCGEIEELASFRITRKCSQQLVRCVKPQEENIYKNYLDAVPV